MGDPLRLYGLRAMVFSGGAGIGEAIARTLVKHGATVVAIDSKNSGVEQHYARVKGISGQSANLLDGGDVEAAIAAAVESLGGLDILVNEFPIPQDAPLADVGDKYERVINTRAALMMTSCRAALPHLQKSPAGRIINMGLLRSAFAANGTEVSRKAEKDLANLTRALAVEIGDVGITSNYVQPGGVMTPESRDVFRRHKGLRDYCIKSSAQSRLGEPVDIAKVVLFLASDDAVFVNGTGIAVDGGRTAD